MNNRFSKKLALIISGICLISLPMCENDLPSIDNSSSSSLANSEKEYPSAFKNQSSRVQSLLSLSEYSEFIKSWVDVSLWADKVFSKCSESEKQSLLSISKRFHDKSKVEESELVLLVGEENFRLLEKVAKKLYQTTNKLVKVCPFVLNMSEDEVYSLAVLSYDSGMIPVELFAPGVDPGDTSNALSSSGGTLQQCLDDAKSSYNWCFAYNMISMAISDIIGLAAVYMSGGLYYFIVGSTVAGGLTAISNESCWNNYFRDVDLCNERYRGREPN